jgi:hypothetical protein
MSVFDDFPHGIMLEICQYLIGTVDDLEKYQSPHSVLLPYVYHPKAVKEFTINAIIPDIFPYKLSKLTVTCTIMNHHIMDFITSMRSLRELCHNHANDDSDKNTQIYSYDNLRTLLISGKKHYGSILLKKSLKRLHTLTIKYCRLTHDNILSIAQLPALRTLDLIECALYTPGISIPVLTKIPLRFLDIKLRPNACEKSVIRNRLRSITYEHQLMICRMPIKYLCISDDYKDRLMELFQDPQVNGQFTAHIMMAKFRP